MDLLFLCIGAGYLLGSIPTAYFIVRSRSGADIRKSGSGNVGARNTYDVTGSKGLGIIVLLLDYAKGFVATLLPLGFVWGTPALAIAAGIGAVVGHNYPVWLRFHGGRGLSTTAGVMMVLGWLFVIVWCSLWCIVYLRSKDILLGNILASVLAVPILLTLPDGMLTSTSPAGLSAFEVFAATGTLCVLILVRHGREIAGYARSGSVR